MRIDSYNIKCFLLLLLSIPVFTSVQASTLSHKTAKYLYDLNTDRTKNLLLPSDVVVNKGYKYVVDGGNHRVVVFDGKGKHQFSFGKQGKKKSEFKYPVGIDVAANGLVFVADSGNKRIQVFNSKGKYIRQFKVKSGRYRIRPIDVLVDEKNNELYVTGNETHEVLVFSLKGTFKRKWGGNGVGEGEFRYPATLSHLKDGRIAVVDVLNSRVQVFTKDGKYSSQISGWGVIAGQLFRPKGIAVNNKGHIYISDSYLNIIQVFEDSGQFLHVLKMKKDRQLMTPVGIGFDSRGQLHITEMRKNRISVFNVNP